MRFLVKRLRNILCVIFSTAMIVCNRANADSSTTSSPHENAVALISKIDAAPPAAATAPGSTVPIGGDCVQWRLDTAQKLLNLARWLTSHGNAADGMDAGRRAINHLNVALQLASTQGATASARIYDLQGLVYERALSDSASALTSYQAALAADSNNAHARSRIAALGGGSH